MAEHAFDEVGRRVWHECQTSATMLCYVPPNYRNQSDSSLLFQPTFMPQYRFVHVRENPVELSDTRHWVCDVNSSCTPVMSSNFGCPQRVSPEM